MVKENSIVDKETNVLFPIFLKLETLRVLIVGGGPVGLETQGNSAKFAVDEYSYYFVDH
jgi:hypothetical protein